MKNVQKKTWWRIVHSLQAPYIFADNAVIFYGDIVTCWNFVHIDNLSSWETVQIISVVRCFRQKLQQRQQKIQGVGRVNNASRIMYFFNSFHFIFFVIFWELFKRKYVSIFSNYLMSS